MTSTEIVIPALAADMVSTLWFESSLLAGARAYLEAKGGRLLELAGCRLCFTCQATLAVLAIVYITGPVGGAVAAILATQRMALAVHQLLGRDDALTDATQPGRRQATGSPPAVDVRG